MKAPAPHRFGFAEVLARLLAYRAEAEAAAEADAQPDPERSCLDRRRVLARLARDMDVEPALLLERGFERAYRRMVEGV